LDSSSPLPPSVVSIRHEERRVLENAKIRIRSFNDDPAVPVPITPKTNILMIAPNQDIQCMTYDVWDIIEDLLNDGDHPDHAVFDIPPNLIPNQETNCTPNYGLETGGTGSKSLLDQTAILLL